MHLDEVFVRINGDTYYLWGAVDHVGEVPETFVTKKRDRRVALKFIKKITKRFGCPEVIVPVAIVTGKPRSYRAAMKMIGNEARQETQRWFNNRAKNSHQPFLREIKLCENERWQSLEVINHCRNLSQFILPFTIILTWNVIFIIVKASNPITRER